jgi:beta-aspartyl-peptidase (threonine type)
VDKPRPPRPALIVHAGAWDVPEEEKPAHADACRRAVLLGWDLLRRGGTALEAVTAAVALLEDDPALNAGRGSVLCRDGWVELDAGVMDGTTLDVGAVAGVRNFANPVRLAREVLASEHALLVGHGAEGFARERGLLPTDPEGLVVPRERRRLAAWRSRQVRGEASPPTPADTVGAVGVDAGGCIAVACSTGGMVGKRSGRVGDAPLPGCGYYADDLLAGAVCTGSGEHILRIGLARRAVLLAQENAAEDACWLAVSELQERVQGRGGLILIARDGSIGYGFNTDAMPVAWMDAEMDAPAVRGLGGTSSSGDGA